jgi:hypothetical protein
MVGLGVGGRKAVGRGGESSDRRRTYNSYVISAGVALIFVNRQLTIECKAATPTNQPTNETQNFGPLNTF